MMHNSSPFSCLVSSPPSLCLHESDVAHYSDSLAASDNSISGKQHSALGPILMSLLSSKYKGHAHHKPRPAQPSLPNSVTLTHTHIHTWNVKELTVQNMLKDVM